MTVGATSPSAASCRPDFFHRASPLQRNTTTKSHSQMHLKDLKKNTPAELVAMAEEMGIEGASTLRKQDLMFGILKVRAETGAEIMGMGTIEVLNDGFGFLRSPEANYLAGPDDIVLVAGKGHENYQEIRGVKAPFDDKLILTEIFAELGK